MEETELQTLRQKWNSDEILISGLQTDILSAVEKKWLISLAGLLGMSLLAFAIVLFWNRTLRWKAKTKTLTLENGFCAATGPVNIFWGFQ